MLRTEEREICGARYESVTLPARINLALGARLAKILVPTIGALGGSIGALRARLKAGEGEKMLAEGLLGKAAQALVTQLDKEDVVDLVLKLLASTIRVDPATKTRQEVGEGAIFDNVYAGELGEMVQALRFVLEVNFRNFFKGLGIGGLLERAKKVEESMRSQES